MAKKANFLAIAALLIFFILIVNAYSEEKAGEDLEGSANETLDLNNPGSEINGSAEAASKQNDVENIQNNENKGKAVTASFGVYLNIVG
ncbi:hypothetical protein HYX05_03130 [Candidatus Woesearchaeota archaeon]|nr:hypothetical protein [Candidatus Woesearchaeota archaeon]